MEGYKKSDGFCSWSENQSLYMTLGSNDMIALTEAENNAELWYHRLNHMG